MRRALLIVTLLATLGAGNVGEKVGPIPVRDLKGAEVTLAPKAGRSRVLVFFATLSKESTALLKELAQPAKALERSNVEVVGIALQIGGADTIGDLARKEGIEFPLYLGDQEASKAFDVKAFPSAFVVSNEGIIRARFEGPSAKAAEIVAAAEKAK